MFPFGTDTSAGIGATIAALVSVSRVFFPAARLQMTNSLFHDNETAEEQGYAVLTANVTAGSRPLLVNNTIANNPAGGSAGDDDTGPGPGPGVYGNAIACGLEDRKLLRETPPTAA